ncbi:LacI family DNA-binding transcriptional regulator [Bifidobacterium platyrrhinorum]|uniref:Substrate-binding domain-containing protein n=1 Tax=Bifidobacterium platyrrhinorum TaxID=2661628 RepID=A0A6L9SQH7_9BIFI|nr:LacI family DNA-binding transcriptional regulator [Bifidobacterium platyrrhinorum]NEG54239.1 substrate-binding domain-containing protein [Bifidobacterium platyrrhinorum]
MRKGIIKESPRLEDVAKRAGVSLSTASKALHDNPRVSAKTRQLVQRIAHEMSYTPNALAQSLINGMSGTVGLVTSDMSGRFCTQIMMGAENVLGSKSISVLLTNARNDPTLEAMHIRKLLSLRVDGLILMGRETDPRPSLSEDIPVPVVYAYAPSENPQDASVTCDNVDAGRMAVGHLLSCGRRRIAIIGGDPSFSAATDRTQGSLDALDEAGLEPVGPIRYGTWDGSWGRGATRLLLDDPDLDFDAIICQNDQIARGCIDVLKERGLKVPDDVAVIGHDNWKEIVDVARPTLTDLDNRAVDIGRRAAEMLIDAINGHPHHGVELLKCKLIQRESTVPLE